jgi:hypothetical protein
LPVEGVEAALPVPELLSAAVQGSVAEEAGVLERKLLVVEVAPGLVVVARKL